MGHTVACLWASEFDLEMEIWKWSVGFEQNKQSNTILICRQSSAASDNHHHRLSGSFIPSNPLLNPVQNHQNTSLHLVCGKSKANIKFGQIFVRDLIIVAYECKALRVTFQHKRLYLIKTLWLDVPSHVTSFNSGHGTFCRSLNKLFFLQTTSSWRPPFANAVTFLRWRQRHWRWNQRADDVSFTTFRRRQRRTTWRSRRASRRLHSRPWRQQVPDPNEQVQFCVGMELFSSMRWRLHRPKQKAVVFMLNPPKIYNTCVEKFHSCWTLGSIQLFISFYKRAPWRRTCLVSYVYYRVSLPIGSQVW